MKIGEKLEILREERQLTQARMAEIIGGDQSTLSKVLAGKPGRHLGRGQYLKVARHFHVTVESLLDDTMDLERVSESEGTVLQLVRILGIEESLRRLSRPTTPGQDQTIPRFGWGQMGRAGGGTAERPRDTSGQIGA